MEATTHHPTYTAATESTPKWMLACATLGASRLALRYASQGATSLRTRQAAKARHTAVRTERIRRYTALGLPVPA